MTDWDHRTWRALGCEGAGRVPRDWAVRARPVV